MKKRLRAPIGCLPPSCVFQARCYLQKYRLSFCTPTISTANSSPFLPLIPKMEIKVGFFVGRHYVGRVRAVEPNVLVFFSGDLVQGTPYFNFFKGEAEVAMLNYIKPTAATLGNHEFDNGVDQLATMLKGARFPIICTNYQVAGTHPYPAWSDHGWWCDAGHYR